MTTMPAPGAITRKSVSPITPARFCPIESEWMTTQSGRSRAPSKAVKSARSDEFAPLRGYGGIILTMGRP